MLFGDRAKLAGIVIGLTFAALIMTQQPAIFLGLMSRTYSFIWDMPLPDLWVMDPSVQYVEENKALRDAALWRVRGVSGVAWAAPLYKSFLTVRLPDGQLRTVDLSGLDDATLVGAPPRMVAGKVADLRRTDGIIVDQDAAQGRLASHDRWGRTIPLKIGDVLELNDRRAVVVGIAKMSRTFTLGPMVFTTYSRALSYAPQHRNNMSYILVKAKPGVSLEELRQNITQVTGLAALTQRGFMDTNLRYWMDNTGIPINFGTAVILGFLVGAAVSGQTFYNFTRDNLRQFGTLKAMGAGNLTLLRMILLQAATVGAIGYGLGVGLTTLFAIKMHDSVLAIYFPWQLLLFSAAGIGAIMMLAALVSIITVFRLEAAIVFRS